MDMEDIAFSVTDLEKRTYRYLQQVAKSLGLPSNVKKVYLICLIRAKKYKSEAEVNSIIHLVKMERQQAQSRKRNLKKHLQNREISSTNKLCQSPPISNTPRRPVHGVLRYSPELHKYLKCGQGVGTNSTNIGTTTGTNIGANIGSNLARSVTGSDRVLRSFNLKTLRKTYGAVNYSNPAVRNQATSPKETRIKIVSAGRVSEVNVTKCMERRHRPSILGSSFGVRNNQKRYIIAHNAELSAPLPKRQRTISGIYPLMPEIEYNMNTIQGVRLRRNDGRLSTINALVQKRSLPERFKPMPKHNEITIQDIFGSIDTNDLGTHANYLQTYPNIGHTDLLNNNYVPISERERDLHERSVYYHKKIRSEQVRYQRMNYREGKEEMLPKINDAFSRFNGVRDVTQPLYIQVGEPDLLPTHTYPRNIANTHMLESLYNFRSNLLTNTPLLQIATTSNTKCVYSTPVIATAMLQQPATLVPTEPFNMPPCEPDNQYRCSHDVEMPHLYELIKPPEQDLPLRFGYRGDISTSTSSLDTSNSQMGGSATIPEMVEDALEIISQDGDYMEQIGMDLRVQCVLCSWAGPKIILEFHIRKEHPTQIHKLTGGEGNVVHTLGSMAHCRLWLGAVLEHDAMLYVLSTKYEEDCLMATLSSLSSDVIEKHGTIIIYNKVTGEPYSFAGDIQPLPPNLPYENDVTGLKVDLAKLDLLPNSANLKLVNNELVLKSPTKVVVGQPELNDIHIILFVRIS